MMENFVNDFYSVLNYLSIEKAIVCGLSMGGYITLRAAIKYPDKFSAIILADTKAEKDDDTGLIARANSIDQIKTGKLKEFLEDFLTKLISKNSINNSELIALLNGIMNKQTPEGICAALIVLATRTNTIDSLDTINIPSLIIVGEEDVLTPLKFAENMNNKLNHSKLEIIPGTGHLSNLENPSKFNLIVDKFLDNLKLKK